MDKAEVTAKIYNLSASILLGKATKEEIARISALAREYGCFDVFKDEIKDCDKIITSL